MKLEYMDIYELQNLEGDILTAYDTKETALDEISLYEDAVRIVHTRADDSCRFYDPDFTEEIVYTTEENTITYEHIAELLEDAVCNVFVTLQDENGITDGGIEPLRALYLERRQKELTDIILSVVRWQYANK